MHESEILQLLIRIRRILEDHDVKFWVDHFAGLERDFNKAIAAGDHGTLLQGMKRIAEMYGGMGSFNDLFINERAGDRIEPGKESTVNRELGILRTQLYDLVMGQITKQG